MKIVFPPFRFRGRIHPHYEKEGTATRAARPLDMPDQLTISLAQHLGAPARPTVTPGDTVAAGQSIGAADGLISAPVHAPAAGTVESVAPAPLPNGRMAPAIRIRVDHDATSKCTLPAMTDWKQRPPRELAERIGEAGVVGLGGAGFPTRVKLSPPTGKKIDTLILNGAECEPYLTSDHRLMLEQAEAIAEGAAILRHILGAQSLRVAIEDNKPDAVKAMVAALKDFSGDVQVVVLESSYPQGSEKQQIYAVTGRKTPAGGLPMDVGVVVENVATTYAAWDAVCNGAPLTGRIVTVTGDAVQTPSNLWTPIGASIADLVAACDGLYRKSVRKIILGGPMMGLAQHRLDLPVTKTVSGLVALTATRLSDFASTPCIGCGRCLDACAMRLSPAELSQTIEADDLAEAEALHVMDCFECGACAFACPAHRPLVQHMRRAKSAILSQRASKRASPS